ncbi:hypothetical protein CEXT_382051 [Caerostris extrusa]|uniref:Uncharacterized protein n=1 Tax=Caerostris extrusa TaxID=172846 RepID=A0AAV4SMH1_CAEEX|nr:hypothetical protein CEXT_382051 [Caerostris extrusa]
MPSKAKVNSPKGWSDYKYFKSFMAFYGMAPLDYVDPTTMGDNLENANEELGDNPAEEQKSCIEDVVTVKLQNICDGIDEVIRSAQDTAVEPTVMTTNLQKIRAEVKEYFAHTHVGNNEPCSEDDIPEQDDKGEKEN